MDLTKILIAIAVIVVISLIAATGFFGYRYGLASIPHTKDSIFTHSSSSYFIDNSQSFTTRSTNNSVSYTDHSKTFQSEPFVSVLDTTVGRIKANSIFEFPSKKHQMNIVWRDSVVYVFDTLKITIPTITTVPDKMSSLERILYGVGGTAIGFSLGRIK